MARVASYGGFPLTKCGISVLSYEGVDSADLVYPRLESSSNAAQLLPSGVRQVVFSL